IDRSRCYRPSLAARHSQLTTNRRHAAMAIKESLLSLVERKLDAKTFRDEHWEGSFEEYMEVVSKNPRIARNSFQRIYDMILHFGIERYSFMREEMTRYKFFSDPIGKGEDAIFGLERSLMTLVDFFKSASHGYGTEHRILLLHGPVGSSKSTIVRLLKKGLAYYSRLDEGGMDTFQPKDEKNQDSTELTGDINYRKIAEYGSDSDPRAFNFDGELNIANRGLVEFIEVLKLDVAFLYDLLGASQEHVIKPKKF